MRLVYLNFHSTFAIELATSFISSGSQLCGCTIDCLHKANFINEFLQYHSCPVVLDSTEAWQRPHLFSESSNQIPLFDSSERLTRVRHSLATWFLHRENFGMGLSEDLLNFLIITTINNAHRFLEATQPDVILSTFAPSTPFDIAISALSPIFNASYIFLNDLPAIGLYYLTSSVDSHTPPNLVPNIAPTRGHEEAAHLVANRIWSSVKDSSPYYIPKNIVERDITIQSSIDKLKEISATALRHAQSKSESSNNPFYVRFTSDLLRSLSFISSRDMKFLPGFQSQKEAFRSKYLSSMIGLLSQPLASSHYILVLLDYYPEITRVPMGGSNYHWYNYFSIAQHLTELFAESNVKPAILVKEHPAMLESSSHSYIRPNLVEYMNKFEIKFLSPFSKLTDILESAPPICVITGVSNAAVECCSLSIPVITPSRPWWLCLPNTYHVNPFMPLELFSDLQSPSALACFSSFLQKYSFDLSHPMHSLDTLYATLESDQLATINSIVTSILTYPGLPRNRPKAY